MDGMGWNGLGLNGMDGWIRMDGWDGWNGMGWMECDGMDWD